MTSEHIPIKPLSVKSSSVRSRIVKCFKSLIGYFLLLILITHSVDLYRLSEHDGRQIPPDLLPQLIDQLTATQQQTLLSGEPMLLYVWASWCGVCRTTSWAVSNIAEDYPVASIALTSGDQAQVEDYLQQNRYDFPALADANGQWMKSLQVHATPSFFIVNNSGHILYYSVGINTEPGLRAKLALYHLKI